jgi:hypothetical protein
MQGVPKEELRLPFKLIATLRDSSYKGGVES